MLTVTVAEYAGHSDFCMGDTRPARCGGLAGSGSRVEDRANDWQEWEKAPRKAVEGRR